MIRKSGLFFLAAAVCLVSLPSFAAGELVLDAPLDFSGTYSKAHTCSLQKPLSGTYDVNVTSTVKLTLLDKQAAGGGNVEMQYLVFLTAPVVVFSMCKQSYSSTEFCYLNSDTREPFYSATLTVLWEKTAEGSYRFMDTSRTALSIESEDFDCVCAESCGPTTPAYVSITTVPLKGYYEDFAPVAEGIGIQLVGEADATSTSIACENAEFATEDCALCFTSVCQRSGNFDLGAAPETEPPETGVIKGELVSAADDSPMDYATIELYLQEAQVR